MKKLLLLIAFFVFLLPVSVMAASVTKTIAGAPGASGTWTGEISSMFNNPGGQPGYINISIYGVTWAGTVTLQRKFSGDAVWYDVDTWTANSQNSLTDTEKGVRYRLGIDNGDFTSGSVAVRLSN